MHVINKPLSLYSQGAEEKETGGENNEDKVLCGLGLPQTVFKPTTAAKLYWRPKIDKTSTILEPYWEKRNRRTNL